MLKLTKCQLRYYKSQLYNAFVISDGCNRSFCVIPFKTEMAKRALTILYINFVRMARVDPRPSRVPHLQDLHLMIEPVPPLHVYS